MKRRMLAAVLLAAILVGCDDLLYCDCHEEIDDLVEQFGEPEDIESVEAQGYHSRTYWYWTRGFAKTFTWGESVPGCCEMVVFTFPAIKEGELK